MNIICNNCVGARLYEVTKRQFPNPFMWMIMTPGDFISLANSFDEIDLKNVKFELERYKKNQFDSVLTTLPGDIKLHFIHYIQDDVKIVPTKEKNTNILYKDILGYASEKWYKRLERMNEDPVFVFSFNYMSPDHPAYNETLNQLKQIAAKWLIILMHDGLKIDADGFSNKTDIIKFDHGIMSLNGTNLANAIASYVFK